MPTHLFFAQTCTHKYLCRFKQKTVYTVCTNVLTWMHPYVVPQTCREKSVWAEVSRQVYSGECERPRSYWRDNQSPEPREHLDAWGPFSPRFKGCHHLRKLDLKWNKKIHVSSPNMEAGVPAHKRYACSKQKEASGYIWVVEKQLLRHRKYTQMWCQMNWNYSRCNIQNAVIRKLNSGCFETWIKW